MKLPLVDRLVLKELVGNFSFGTGLFTCLFVSAEIVMGVGRALLETGGGTALLGTYLLNRLPQILVLTLPMAVLLSVLLGFGRLSSQRELPALRACGYRFIRIALPALLFGALVSGVSMAFSQWVVPPTMSRANSILLQSLQTSPVLRGLVSGPRVLASGEVLVLCAETLDSRGGEMRGVFLHYFWEGRRRRVIYADQAVWNGHGWSLHGMRWTEFDSHRELGVEMRASQAWTSLPVLDSPGDPRLLAHPEPLPDEQSPGELFARARSGRAAPGGGREAARLEMLAWQKIGLPLACFVFAGFGVPLGVQPYRTGASTGFGLSLLFILVYYALMTTGMLLGECGSLSPALAAWLPHLFFGAVATYLLYSRERIHAS